MKPREIVDLLGNIGNRADINEMKDKQEKAIVDYAAVEVLDALDREWVQINAWKPFLHYCMDWDGLLIDNNDAEFMCCNCFEPKPKGRWEEERDALDAFNEANDKDFGNEVVNLKVEKELSQEDLNFLEGLGLLKKDTDGNG